MEDYLPRSHGRSVGVEFADIGFVSTHLTHCETELQRHLSTMLTALKWGQDEWKEGLLTETRLKMEDQNEQANADLVQSHAIWSLDCQKPDAASVVQVVIQAAMMPRSVGQQERK